jgi:glutamate-5-semialdehyde dehydrogenase
VTTIREQAVQAKSAARRLAVADRAQKDKALAAIAAGLRRAVSEIEAANAADLAEASAAGMSGAMLDRLRMDSKTIESTARGVEFVMGLPDPVGSRSSMQRLASGILAGRQRVPLGVIAIVYESRPNVTVDAAALCLKSGNAALLRGGKEAKHTNCVLGHVLGRALAESGLPPEGIAIIPPGDRDGIRELVSLSGLVDLAIPRGGEGLIRFVVEHARVPVVQHYKGVCHMFVDQGADLEMATRLALNGKVQRPGVCNALECLLVHASDAERLLPPVARALLAEGVELRGCVRTRELVPEALVASDADYGAEFLAKILAVRVVADYDAAVEHIATYGSNHTEVICTNDWSRGQRFLREVDASCVLVNASTRFNDGGQLGLGAEIGISTTKMHAYGPMGLEHLTSEMWVVEGEGQIRS